jgi:DNA-directed RNA polymerase alpha subunit
MNIETDGTITPTEAVESAAKMLMEHFELFRDLSAASVGVPEVKAETKEETKEEASEETPKKAKKKKSE